MVLLRSIETRAGFVGKDVVSHDEGSRVGLLEFDEESSEGGALLGSSGIFGFFVVGGHASDVTDTDGVSIVVHAVGTDLFFWASFVDAAIAIDDVVITDAFPTSGFVPAIDVLDGIVLAFGSGGAVDDDKGYCSHGGSGGFKGLILDTSAEKSPFDRRMLRPSLAYCRMVGICDATANINSRPTAVMTLPSITPMGGQKKPPMMSERLMNRSR